MSRAASIAAVVHNIETLRSPEYLQSLQKLPPQQQQVKQQLYPAFRNMLQLLDQKKLGEMNALIQKLLAVAPAHAEIYLLLGQVVLEIVGDPGKSKVLFEAFTQLHPKRHEGWLFLAEALFRLYHFSEAREMAEKAIALKPDAVQAYVVLGKAANNLRDFEAACRYNRKGLEYDPQNPTLLRNLGAALQFMGDQAAAEAFYHEQLEKNPHFYAAYDGLGYTLRECSGNEPWLVEGERIAEEVEDTAEGVDSLYFGLGTLFRKAGNREKSWKYLEKYHAVSLRGIGGNPPDLMAQDYRITTGFFTREHLAQPELKRARPHPRTQPVFIVGMPRSGTTLVEQILDSHSRVTGCGELRELNAFTNNIPFYYGIDKPYPESLRAMSEANLQDLANRYMRAMLDGVAADQHYAIDKSPFNFYRLGQIYQLFPEAKIIHCTRNPMDICVSVYTNRFPANMYWAHSMEHIGTFYSYYRKVMAHWQEALPMPVHTISYETMVAEPKEQTEALLNFLELDWEDACLSFHENKRAVDTASVWQVRQPIHTKSVARWRKYEKELQPFIAAIGDYAEEWL